jgi:putative transposase
MPTGMTARYTPRHPTMSYNGTQPFSWTICVYQRRHVFTSHDVVSPVLSHFLRAADATDVAVIAYCFMPDHLHLLLEGKSENAVIDQCVIRGKQYSGFWFAKKFGSRLWQKSSWDRALRAEDDRNEVIRYILANPVRAGIVDTPLEYEFSGSFVYEREDLIDVFHTAG